MRRSASYCIINWHGGYKSIINFESLDCAEKYIVREIEDMGSIGGYEFIRGEAAHKDEMMEGDRSIAVYERAISDTDEDKEIDFVIVRPIKTDKENLNKQKEIQNVTKR